MPSCYLTAADFDTYGLPPSTARGQITAASALVDAYLDRPEGVVWMPDWSGLPCYMAAANPSFSLTAPGAIAPGINVVVATGNPANLSDLIGEAVVLDRATDGLVEACAIVGTASGSITLASVAKGHSSGCTLDLGLGIKEERSLPDKRSVTRVSARPIVRLLAGAGRFGYGRRSQQQSGTVYETNLLAMMQPFGGPPPWVAFDASTASISSATGEIWIPPGLLYNANFTDARVCYVAGFSAAGLPSIVKSATAAAVNAATQFPELTGNIKMARAGDTAVERFKDSILDADTKAQLAFLKSFAFA